MKKVLVIKENELKVGKILKEGITNATPVENLIAAKVLLDEEISKYKAYADLLDETIKNTDYEKNMKDRGVINDGDKVEVAIETVYGDTISVSVSRGLDSGFDIDALKEKAIMDTLVPDAYKKINVTLDKKKIENDYELGLLSEDIKRFIKKNPRMITKLRRSIKKGE